MAAETLTFRIGALAATLCLAGCTDHLLANRDTISPYAGESIAYNKSIHIIDPFPSYGSSIGRTQGSRVEETMTRYRSGAAPSNAKPAAAAAAPIVIPGIAAPAPTN